MIEIPNKQIKMLMNWWMKEGKMEGRNHGRNDGRKKWWNEGI